MGGALEPSPGSSSTTKPSAALCRYWLVDRSFREGLKLGLGLEEVFVFDSKSENRDRAVEAVQSVSETRAL